MEIIITGEAKEIVELFKELVTKKEPSSTENSSSEIEGKTKEIGKNPLSQI